MFAAAAAALALTASPAVARKEMMPKARARAGELLKLNP